jgi:cytochrome P450
MATDSIHRTLDELPIFDEWNSDDFGVDLSWVSDDLFKRPYQGVLRGSDGSAVFYRHADLRTMAITGEATHQTPDSIQFSALKRAGHEVDSMIRLLADGTFTMRAPHHAPNKKLMSRRLTTGSVARWQVHTRQLAQARLDAIPNGTSFDFVADFARPFVVDFWHGALGVSHEEGNVLVAALENVQTNSRSEADEAQLARANEGARRYLDVLPAALRREMDAGGNPVLDGLREDYAAAGEAARPADPCVAFATTLMDGWRTVPGAVAAALFPLLSATDAYAQLRRDAELVPSAFHEGMRLHGGITLTQREAARDFVYEGIAIPAGTQLSMMWSFANRDPSVFEDPNRYRLIRDNRGKQMSFGGGVYACTGRNLVRMLFETVFGVLATEDLELTLEDGVEWLPATIVHEIAVLPVRLRRR